MRFTRSASVHLVAGAILLACGGDDSTSTTPPASTAKKADGEGPCATGTECQSGECFVGGKESFCTIKCTMPEQNDPVCTGAPLSGECNKQSYCKKK